MPKLDKYSIEDLQSVSILSIAEELGLKVTRSHKCLCPFHEDKSPSLKFWPSVNGWKCYGCGAKGTNIDLVMKMEGLKFHEACEWIARQNSIMLRYEDEHPIRINIRPRAFKPKLQISKPTKMLTLNPNLITQYQGSASAFCRSIVSTSILTQEQQAHAIEVYKLGCTQDDGVIFWQIDHNQQVRDGKVMFYNNDCHRDHKRNPSWISYRLKQKGVITQDWQATYCLFGLHLLGLRHNNLSTSSGQAHDDNYIIAIVESEKTAIICSELIHVMHDRPVIWLATGGFDFLTTESLRPLVGHDVTIFPDTDISGQTFSKWQDVIQEATSQLNHAFYISNLLELHATEDQKRRKIDIADFIIESKG